MRRHFDIERLLFYNCSEYTLHLRDLVLDESIRDYVTALKSANGQDDSRKPKT